MRTELTRQGSWSAVAASLLYALLAPALKDALAGAQTSIQCAVDPDLQKVAEE